MPTIEDIERLAKRRGIFYLSSEIYGGLAGLFDYGSTGTLIKRNMENLWRKFFLHLGENFFEIDASNIMPEKVFVASGHLENFVDPVAKCKKCGTAHRADHIAEGVLKESFEGMTPIELTELIKQHKIRCTKCKGELGDVKVFNMTFPLSIGSTGEIKAYLRPETAQSAYVNFLQQFEVQRKRLPLGLAIVGKAFRNELSPRQLTTRMREFTQAELQVFFDPQEIEEHEMWPEVENYMLVVSPADKREQKPLEMSCSEFAKKYKVPKFYVYHMARVQQFFFDALHVSKDKFRFKELTPEERAFYNKIHWDMELNLESMKGWKEIGGVHYRTDHDLKGHEKISGKSHEIFFNEKKVVPHVLELSFGIDRIIYAMLDLFYHKDGDRAVLSLVPTVAPFTVAVFPLVSKDGIDQKAKNVHMMLRNICEAFYDDDGSIGRRYARADEIGIPFCITIDYDTMKDGTVTVRNRDDKSQRRVKIEELPMIV